MCLTEKIKNAETHQFRIIFNDSVNNNNNLFGGIAMQWMDEVAYITATRFTRKKMVTVSCDKIKFIRPVKIGSIIEIVGSIGKIGHTKLTIPVIIFCEEMYSSKRCIAVEANFTFAALDQNNNPIRLDTIEDMKELLV